MYHLFITVFGDEYGVDGVPLQYMGEFFRRLQEQGLGARQGGQLVDCVRTVIKTMMTEQEVTLRIED